MKIILIFCLFLALTNDVSAQEPGWQWLNPKPQGNGISSMYFTSEMVGYAATQSNCVMKTTDGGLSWKLKYILEDITLVDVQFVNSQTGYISTTTNKLCKTTNAGENWVVIESLRPDLKFRNFTFINPNNGYAAYDSISGNKAYTGKTTDGGISWVEIRVDLQSLQSRIVYNDNELFLAWTRDLNPDTSYIHKSTNDGISWFQISQFPFYSIQDFKFTSASVGYIQTSVPNYTKHYRTTDAGNTWLLINDSLKSIQAIDDNNLVGLRYTNLYKSSNGGINWQISQISSGSIFDDYYYFINSNTGIIAGNDYIRTTNGGTNWLITHDNIANDFWGMDFIDANTGFLSGYNHVYKTTDGGENWDTSLTRFETFEDIQFLNSQTGYMGGFSEATIAKTTNCGANWDILPTSIHYGITAIDFIDVNTGYATAKYGPVAKTTNSGLNWANVTTIEGQSWDIDFINANTGLVVSGSKLKRTSDGGITWVSITLPQNMSAYQVKFIDENMALTGGGGGICKSSNGGINWFVSYNTNRFVGEIEYKNNIVYALANSGGEIYKSTDMGNVWRTYKTISNATPWRIKFTNENTGYICGFDGLLIKTTNGGFDPIGIEPISAEIPNKFLLHQNYPNPFNPATIIKFDLPKAGLVSLKIYNLLGQQVSELVNQNLNAGVYEYNFDGAGLPSGVYFYRLETGGVIETKRMMLIK